MSDRLDEIKERVANILAGPKWLVAIADTELPADLSWLIAEVERLSRALVIAAIAIDGGIEKSKAQAADILVLRTALQALYDATESASFSYYRNKLKEAHEAAGVVLGGGNE